MSDEAAVHVDLRDLERSILRQCAGCETEDEKNATFGVAVEVCLHTRALAHKILGYYGKQIGFDPRLKARYGLEGPPDFDRLRHEARTAIYYRDLVDGRGQKTGEEKIEGKELAALLKQKLHDIDLEEARAKQLDAQFDPVAWANTYKVEDMVRRRALALERLGLVIVDVAGMVDKMTLKDNPEAIDTPWEGTVAITEKGLWVVSTNKRLVPARSVLNKLKKAVGFKSVHPLDEDLEIV